MKEPGTCRPAEVSKLRAEIAVHINDDFNEFENAATLSGTALTRIANFHHSLTHDVSMSAQAGDWMCCSSAWASGAQTGSCL